MAKAKRKPGNTSRWIAEIIGGKRGDELREEGRILDRKYDQKKGAKLREIRAARSVLAKWEGR